MKYLLHALLSLALVIVECPVWAQQTDVFKLSATENVEQVARSFQGHWRVFQYQIVVEPDSGATLCGRIIKAPPDDASYKVGTRMFENVRRLPDGSFTADWINYSGDGPHKISTTTPATIVLESQRFVVNGRRAVARYQYFVPDPGRTRNWRWDSELGSPFSYTFDRLSN